MKSLFRSTLIAAAIAVVIWFYYWTVRSSGGFNPPGEEDYYNFLVRGWRQGHLHMSKEPKAEMRTLADPYDPAQNSNVRLADASYFRGHNYLYFGAAPAFVLMLPYDLLTGREMGTTTAIFLYCATGFLAVSGLWLAIRRRYFPASARWVGPVGVLMLGLATHVLALERRPLVWELPISAGFAFSMLAVVGVYVALHGRRPVLAMGLAGLSLGLAVASRPTCILAAVMFIPPLWHFRRTAAEKSLWWRCGLSTGLGIGVCLVAVVGHNFARFGNPLEFGQNYQLSGVYESKVRHFRWAYLLHNFYIYYLHAPQWTREFPLLSASAVRGGPEGYLGDWNEPICGLAVTLPFLWLALASPWARRNPESGGAASLGALLGSVAIYYFVMNAAIMGYFVATPRYLADFTPALGLLAAIGWLGLEQRAQRHGWNRLVTSLIAIVCLVTTIAGVLMSFDYHGRAARPGWAGVGQFFDSALGHTKAP